MLILENAKQTYVLVDSSKIGQTCFAKVAPLKRAIVITSQGHELLQAIKEKTEVISMIYTVTLNPSIDYIMRLDQVQVGSVNRMDSDDKFAEERNQCQSCLETLGYSKYSDWIYRRFYW